MPHPSFSEEEQRGVFRAIYERRDIRSYLPDPVEESLLMELLEAAHQAPSVGFFQPWNFILIRDRGIKEEIYRHFREVNDRAALEHVGERRELYQSLKLQGILDAPLSILFTCHTAPSQILGRYTIRQTDLYSTCLAIENFWLAARAKGVGAGWMSLYEPEKIREILEIPEGHEAVALLTVGYPVFFPEEPLLQTVGWRNRVPLQNILHHNRWGMSLPASPSPEDPAHSGEKPKMEESSAPHVGEKSNLARRSEQLTKPAGSLGFLEEIAGQVARIQGADYPRTKIKRLILMAADHGITEEGVSAYEPETTRRMVYQFLAGGGAVNTFARNNGTRVHVADLGVNHTFAEESAVIRKKIRPGTRNFLKERAMTEEETERAMKAGEEILEEIGECHLLALGEMGIGNSTAAAAIACALLERSPEELTGRGTGIGEETLRRKREVIERGLSLYPDTKGDALKALRAFGGYEIAGMAGLMVAAKRRGIPVVLDGVITGAAALIALALEPGVGSLLLAGHLSAEPAHGPILEALKLRPLLSLDMRLGEGSGAVLALGIIEGACKIPSEMKTYEEVNLEDPLVESRLR